MSAEFNPDCWLYLNTHVPLRRAGRERQS